MRSLLKYISPKTPRQVAWQFLVFCGLIVAWHFVYDKVLRVSHDHEATSLLVDSIVVGGPFAAFFTLISWYQVTQLQRLHVSARFDPLSGVLNRQTFLRRAERSIRASRSGMLLVADADFFKNINDKYGHATGDACIRAIGHRLSWHLRENDLAGRVGGEEFAVFLPNVSKEHGRVVAKRLGMPIPFTVAGEEQHLSVSLSMGAVWTSPELSADAQFMLADDALYTAKTMGRARLVIVGEDEPILLGRAGLAGHRRVFPDERRTSARQSVA